VRRTITARVARISAGRETTILATTAAARAASVSVSPAGRATTAIVVSCTVYYAFSGLLAFDDCAMLAQR